MLEIIAELSPCSEPMLFFMATYRGLQRFGDGSLGDLSKLLDQCVQEFQARGLVKINEKHLVFIPAGSLEDEGICKLTAVAGSPENEVILDLPAVVEDEDTTVFGSPENEDILELTTVFGSAEDEDMLELTAVAGSAENEDILELTAIAGSAEAEEILELTAELELRPSLRPSKLDEAPINQRQSPTQSPLAGGPKRAPEPTREEIIAAMRKFISDD